MEVCNKKISVIMPVYNTKEEYLREAIESILNQTYTNFEFIIINDGSTNNAEEVILSYKDDRIIYLKQENQGIVPSLNRGWDISSGEYIARMDSDDISMRQRFEKQIKFLEEQPDYSLVGTQALIKGKNNIIKFPADVRIIDLLADCAFVHSTIMFRKADFDKYNLRYKSVKIAEDYNLYAAAIKYLKMANLSEVLLEYRVYSENCSSKNRDTRVASSFMVQDLLLDYLSGDKSVRAAILDLAYKQKSKDNSLSAKIFSIRNLYKNWAKYKILTILGLEFYVKVKKYNKENF